MFTASAMACMPTSFGCRLIGGQALTRMHAQDRPISLVCPRCR